MQKRYVLCVCYVLECALITGFSAALTKVYVSLIAAFQASYLSTDDHQRNIFACSDLSLGRRVDSGLFSDTKPYTITC